MNVLAAATLPPYVFSKGDQRYWNNWLWSPQALRLDAERVGASLDFFATLETDSRGLDPFLPLLRSLEDGASGRWETFDCPSAEGQYSSANRLAGICAGRNLIQEHASRGGYDWVLFLDADMRPPSDAVSKLLELDYPVVGGHVPTYSLRGPRASRYPQEWDVQSHMNTAGFLLVHREVFTQLTWRTDVERGMTDDPCYHADAEGLGYPTLVRHDLIGNHFPQSLPPVENRGHDLRRFV